MESTDDTNLHERHPAKEGNIEKNYLETAEKKMTPTKSLKQRWKEHRDAVVTAERRPAAPRFFTCFTIFIATSFLYCAHRFWAEMYFTQYGEWAPYYVKVGLTFIYIQVLANWFCTQLYDTAHVCTEDRPEVSNTNPWDDNSTDQRFQRPAKAKLSNLTDEANEKLSKEIDVLSWRFCEKCNFTKPPRAHHCKVCDKCILKRSHHCYITGVCIGHYNERFFVVLTFYISLSMLLLTGFLYCYLRDTFYEDSTIWDYLLPITVYKWLCGYYGHQYILCVIYLYSVWWIFPMTSALFCRQVASIYKGLTAHEMHSSLSLKNMETLPQKLKSVFGDFWLLNFYFPAVIVYRQSTDGKSWKKLKIIYKCRPEHRPLKKDNDE